MDAVRARGDGSERVSECESAVAVSVPIDGDRRAAGGDDFVADEAEESAGASGRGVAHGVADAEARGTTLDGLGVECAECVGMCPRGIFGHEHHRVAGSGGA